MDPINYTSAFAGLPSPNESFMQGVKDGAGLQQLQLQQQQAAAAQQQQLQMRADLQALSQNPTTQAIGQMSIKYPQLSENFKRSFDMLDPAQQQSRLDQATQVYSAVHNGAFDVAQNILKDQATAARNSGNEQDAKAAETIAGLIKDHPEFAQSTVGLNLARVLGKDKFAAAFPAIGGEQRAQLQAPADLAKKQADATKAAADAAVAAGTVPDLIAKPALQNEDIRSQITDRSKRLALDQDKLTTETQIKLTELKQKFGELPEPIVKEQSSAVTDSIASQQSAAHMTGLADKIDAAAASLGSGVTAKTGELWKKTFGSQNDLTRIRSEFNRIVTPAAMAAYKQVASGSASDKDIETAMLGVPTDTADPATMASFLRGAAKLQQYSSVLNNAKSEWLGEVKGLGRTKTDIEIDGFKVPAGSTFKEFTDQYVERKIKALDGAAIRNRSYMKYATPQAPQQGGASGNY